MNININRVKIIVTIPLENVEEVRKAIYKAGACIIGNYTHCSMSTKCVGIFCRWKTHSNKPFKKVVYLA